MLKKNTALILLVLLCVGFLGLAPKVGAQSATESSSSTQSASATTTGSTLSGEEVLLPDELLETGSNDMVFVFGIGAFLIFAGLIGRATLAALVTEE